jgi:hypothetical protein
MTTLTLTVDDSSLAGKHFIGFLKNLDFISVVSQKQQRKNGLEKALEDVKMGRVYQAKSVEDLMNQMEN